MELEEEMRVCCRGEVVGHKIRYHFERRIDGSPGWSVIMMREVSDPRIST